MLSGCASNVPGDADDEQHVDARPVLIATWPFGQEANDVALETMLAGGSALDGIEAGIRRIEFLSSDGSVGLGGRPNAAGYPQLDACIMNGPDHGAGSVAALEGIVHPITVARRVMDSSPHVMLAGEGARWFALEHGAETLDDPALADKKAKWARGEREGEASERGHDTITVLALDANGDLAGGCSTSGSGGKYPGRVGDSPILGAALYVDNDVGAAGATGLGENVMRHCASMAIVERMRQGRTPQQACEDVLHRMAASDPAGYDLSVSFIALDKHGNFGAATSSTRFPFSVRSPDRQDAPYTVEPIARRE